MRRHVWWSLVFVLGLAPSAEAGTRPIFEGSAAIQAPAFAHIEFTVTEKMKDPKLTGRLTAAGGTGDDIVVRVLSDADFINWQNRHEVAGVYNSGQVTIADLNADLPGPGDYVLVFSNLFSSVTPKTVTGKVALTWRDPPPPPQPIAAATQRAFSSAGEEEGQPGEGMSQVVLMIALMLGAGVLGGGVVALTMGRKGRRDEV